MLFITKTALHHGTSGPLVVTTQHKQTPLMHAFLKAGHYLGYDVGDPNGFVQSGNKKLQKFLLFPLSLSLPSEDHVEIILNLCSLCSRHTSVLLQGT